MLEKEKIRTKLLAKRKQMSTQEVYEKSHNIQERLQQHPLFQKSKTILFYVSYGNEVHTHNLITNTLKQNKIILAPQSHIETCTITPIQITSWTDLQTGSYGLLEPKTKKTYNPQDIDLIILPGIGFDRKGNRLGHGKGYYDRLIQQTPQAKRIGLAYDFQIISSIPTQTHDLPVQLIITETETVNCH